MAERARLGTPERPLRVVVVGNSATFLTVPRTEDPDDDPYPGLLAEDLAARGVTATVVLRAQWHATVTELLPRFEGWVRDELPDVVVLNVGIVDCQARVLPTWLLRNTMTWLPGQGAVAHRYRRRVVPRLRTGVREWQRFWAGRVGLQACRVRPSVFRRSVALLVGLCARQTNSDVLVLDIDDANERLLHWMPGLQARIDHYNGLLAAVVAAAASDRVQLVRTSEVVRADPEALLPDGIHRSAEGHRRVSAHLADLLASRWREAAP